MAKNKEFSKRFVEICGTSRPAEIQRMLDISYQTAKNYLEGRLPSAEVLVTICERTPYSLNWLLTGRGNKFAHEISEDTPLPAGEMETFVRRICVEVINEMTTNPTPAQSRIVVLPSSSVLSEKTADQPVTSTGRLD